jgi:hypothetical protein
MNKQARIDPWPSWLGTYLQLIPSHTSSIVAKVDAVNVSKRNNCRSIVPCRHFKLLRG